jgi:Flp pilus assembly pilin Flp
MKTLNNRKQRGQGMTEYIIIVALIAVASIGVYSFFGSSVRNQTAGLAQEVAGVDAGDSIDAAQTAGGDAADAATVDKGLANYNENNNHQEAD